MQLYLPTSERKYGPRIKDSTKLIPLFRTCVSSTHPALSLLHTFTRPERQTSSGAPLGHEDVAQCLPHGEIDLPLA